MTDIPETRTAEEVVVDVDTLRSIASAVIEATGTPHHVAHLVGHSLAESNLVGHDSHGVMRLERYVAAVRAEQVHPDARPQFAQRSAGAGHVDGRWGWGQEAALLATEQAVALARTHAVGAVTIGQCNHVGRLGEHAARIANEGMAGIIVCNAEAVVAPFNGRSRLLGTNPIALACPRGDGAAMVFDVATSAIAEGKLSVAMTKGHKVPLGLVIDSQGAQSTDPRAFYDGGALLPFGAHKGYGLSVFVEVLGGILSGSGAASADHYRGGNGTLVIAIDIAKFMPASSFESQVGELCRRLTESAPDSSLAGVMAPGDLEAATRVHRLRAGIPLPAKTWHDLLVLADGLGIDPTVWSKNRSDGSLEPLERAEP